jgi:hypothetical protein
MPDLRPTIARGPEEYQLEAEGGDMAVDGISVNYPIPAPEDVLKSVPIWRRIWIRLQIAAFGHAFLRWDRKPSWSGYLPINLVKCRRTGRLFLDYPHGWAGYFICPFCEEEQ